MCMLTFFVMCVSMVPLIQSLSSQMLQGQMELQSKLQQYITTQIRLQGQLVQQVREAEGWGLTKLIVIYREQCMMVWPPPYALSFPLCLHSFKRVAPLLKHYLVGWQRLVVRLVILHCL